MKAFFLLFRGYAVVMISVFIFVLILVASQMNIESKVDPKETKAPGDIVVSMVWDYTKDQDVDLILDGPGEPSVVSYKNKGGVLWNLLRDDLGSGTDHTPMNFEDAFTRGIVPGEYVVNVHCYRCVWAPVEVYVKVEQRDRSAGSNQQLRTIIDTKVILYKTQQERTAVRFTMNADKTLDKASVNNVFKPLMNAVK